MSAPVSDRPAPDRPAIGFWSGPWAMMGSFIPTTIQMWLMIPATSLILAERGVSASVIGIFAAVPWGMVLLSTPILPRVIARMGVVQAYRYATILAVAAVLGFYFIDSVPVWFLLNAIFGIGLGVRWLIADSWVAATAGYGNRGRIIGIYETMLGSSIACGPLIVTLVGTDEGRPFLLSLLLLGVAFAFAVPMKDRTLGSKTGERPGNILAIGRRHPSLLLAVLLAGICESSVVAIFPVYGLAIGYDAEGAALMVTLIGFGTIAGQLPLGLFANRFDARRLTFFCALITAGAVLLALPLDPRGEFVWVLRLPWGAAFAGLYTMTMIQAGLRFSGPEMLHAIAAVAATYTMGGMIGPAFTGAAFDLIGPDGVLAAIGLLGVLVAVALAFDLRKPEPERL